MRKMNYPKVQLVQNLHKLQIMARPITTNSTPCPPLLLLATAPIPPVPHNSANCATKVLDTVTRQGYVLDKDRLINGQIFDEDYFDHLVSEIQEICASERRFYQKITDIYATAVDYSVDSKTTKDFL